MADEILDEIWRVREMLVKQHGGWEGYLKHIKKLESAQHRRKQRAQASKKRKRAASK